MSAHRRLFAQAVAIFLVQGTTTSVAGGAEAMYRRVSVAKLGGTSRQGELSVAPNKLRQVFGQPTEEPWDSESLGAFYFQGPNEEVFAVYHRAYDTRRTHELKKSFWSRGSVAEFSIGAQEEAGVAEFKAWLLTRLAWLADPRSRT